MSKQDASVTKSGKVRNKGPVKNKGTIAKGDLGLQIKGKSKKCFCNREAAESNSRAKWVRETQDAFCGGSWDLSVEGWRADKELGSLHRDGGQGEAVSCLWSSAPMKT